MSIQIHFYKYQGAGNDFIIIDNRAQKIALNTEQIARLCDRKFGIGADGLMLLEEEHPYDFRMVYYNSDGNESSMCGNGGRCIVAFARKLSLVNESTHFIAIDGEHKALLHSDTYVTLDMNDVTEIRDFGTHCILNTGSPHYVLWRDHIEDIDVFTEGRAIRNMQEFMPKGINVNFAKAEGNHIQVRTYERGVENETLSCGTGVTACAIAASGTASGSFSYDISTPGGQLQVSFAKKTPRHAISVKLSGPATFVFEGHIRL